ncbi:MAG: hypothetical protein JO347_08515 [Candidatus Eremiobacteraeota bacterium]|nr:hypothetical protein [Candidatus Eremiobacteraeota bacterium]
MKLGSEHIELLRLLQELPESQRETASPITPVCEELEKAGCVRFSSSDPSKSLIKITEVGQRALDAWVVADELVAISGSNDTMGAALALARVTAGSYLSRCGDIEAARIELREIFGDRPGSKTPIGSAILRWLDSAILQFPES